MSIASKLVELSLAKAAIKAAIENRNPSVPPTGALSSFPGAVGSIPGVEPVAPSNIPPVRFIDYDGTVLHSYTAAEAQALQQRLEKLERDLPGHTAQSAAAHSTRFPPWMGFKK